MPIYAPQAYANPNALTAIAQPALNIGRELNRTGESIVQGIGRGELDERKRRQVEEAAKRAAAPSVKDLLALEEAERGKQQSAEFSEFLRGQDPAALGKMTSADIMTAGRDIGANPLLAEYAKGFGSPERAAELAFKRGQAKTDEEEAEEFQTFTAGLEPGVLENLNPRTAREVYAPISGNKYAKEFMGDVKDLPAHIYNLQRGVTVPFERKAAETRANIRERKGLEYSPEAGPAVEESLDQLKAQAAYLEANPKEGYFRDPDTGMSKPKAKLTNLYRRIAEMEKTQTKLMLRGQIPESAGQQPVEEGVTYPVIPLSFGR